MPDGPSKRRRPERHSDNRFIVSEEAKTAGYAAEMYSSSAEETIIGVSSPVRKQSEDVEGRMEPDIAEEGDTAAGEGPVPEEKDEAEHDDVK